MSDKEDIRAKKFTRNRGGHYIMVKEDIVILNMYTPNSRPVKYVKQKLTELKEK